MKRIISILSLAALVLAGCHKVEMNVPEATMEQDIKVPVSFSLMLPSDGVSTKAMADEPEIDHISVAVFGGSGFFNEWIVASIDNVQEVNYDGTPATIYNIRINLTMSDSRLRLHFIANGPVEAPLTGQTAKDNEEGMMSRLTNQLASDHNDGYWQKVVLPLGVHAQTWLNEENIPPTIEYYKVDGQYVPTVETVEQFPNPIKLVRNFARIRVKLANNSDLTEITHFALAYAPMEGAFAPMMSETVNTDEYGIYSEAETDYLDYFVPGYQDLSMDDLKAAPYNYKGFFPSAIQLGGYGDDKTRKYPESDSEMTPWSSDKYLYVYERTVPTSSRPATRLVIKARHKVDGVKYYRIDLHDGGANYALLRNFTYVVTIGSVASGTGRDNPRDAAESPSTSDVSAEITDLPEVSDGIAQIAVQFIENTYVVGGETHTLDFQFIPLISNDNEIDNTKVSIKLGVGVGNEFVEGGNSGNGPAIDGTPTISNTDQDWGRITFTLTNNDKNKFQTIRVIGTKNDGSIVYRDVVIYLKMKQLMTVECLDKYIEEGIGIQERVRVYIPGDLSKSMFPLDFIVEPDSYALNPDGQNMPVNSGKSLSGNNQSVFYFIRSITWEEYQTLPQNGTRKYFECNFKTTKEQNAGKVWVSNTYFLNGADETATNPGSGNYDEYFNYTKRDFSELMFSARVNDGDDVDFSFTMDAAHSGTDRLLPELVTVTLNGLVPRSGYTGLTLKDGEDDVYLYSPGSNPNAVLQLTAIDDDYSVTLTTEDNENPGLYNEASRLRSDPCPDVTSVTVTPASSTVRVGSGVTLTANVAGTMTSGIPVTWTSSDTGIATVNSLGVVTGVSVGTVTITASAGGKSGTATVTVAEPTVTSITVTPATATVRPGATVTLTASRQGTFVEDLPVVWSTGNASVATVNANGVVTGVGAGTTTITATSGGQSASATVTVPPVKTVTLYTNTTTFGNNSSSYTDTSSGITIAFGAIDGRNANYIQYNTRSGTAADRRFTVSIQGGTLLKITPSFSVNNGTISTNPATYSGGSWTGESGTVQFNSTRISNNATHTRLTSITVEYIE